MSASKNLHSHVATSHHHSLITAIYRNAMTEKPSVSAIEMNKLEASFLPEGSKLPVGPNVGGPGNGVPGGPVVRVVPAFL